MNRRKRWWPLVTILSAVFRVALFVWPTPYRYFQTPGGLIRVNRLERKRGQRRL
jgi:hypothetical protein